MKDKRGKSNSTPCIPSFHLLWMKNSEPEIKSVLVLITQYVCPNTFRSGFSGNGDADGKHDVRLITSPG